MVDKAPKPKATPKKPDPLPLECPERGKLVTMSGVQMYIK